MIKSASSQTIDICICTCNREAYLRQCLEALMQQSVAGRTQVTVVDNHSTDQTAAYVQSLASATSIIRYVYEPNPGLSQARNTGWKSSTSDWIFYLDDDCLPPNGIVTEALRLIDAMSGMDAFGGPIEPLFEDEPPAWLPEGFGQFSMTYDQVTPITSGYIRGGCMLIRRSVLDQLSGFNPSFGVEGRTLRYGEEIEFQYRMRKSGHAIAYAPGLKTGHYVRSAKISLRWVLRSEYARRRDKMKIEPVSLLTATFRLLRTIGGRILWTPIHLLGNLIRSPHSMRKAGYQILQPLAYSLGEWIGVIQSSK